MKYFTYHQNNSGGSFDYDDKIGITTNVIIEAKSADEANQIAEKIGIYWNGMEDGSDCECCGDRWHPQSGKGDDVPSVYGMPVQFLTIKNELHKWQKGPECFVHYANGRVTGYYK